MKQISAQERNFLKGDQFKLNRAEQIVARDVRRIAHSGSRIVFVGRSLPLLVHFLDKGYKVLHIEEDSRRVEETMSLFRDLPALCPHLEIFLTPVEKLVSKVLLKDGDTVVFFESLHRAERPWELLDQWNQNLPLGSIVVFDTTTELLERHRVEHQCEARYRETRDDAERRGAEDEVEILDQWWDEHTVREGTFLANIDRHGFADENGVRWFLEKAGVQEYDLEYAPPCICGMELCGEIVYDWMALWTNSFVQTETA